MARRAEPPRQLPPASQAFRGPGARVPGWHAAEVREALIHFAGAKEAIREAADDLRAAAGDPVLAEQRHLELLAAALYPHVRGGTGDLAKAVRFVRHAAAQVALGDELERPAAPLTVVPPAPSRPGEAASGGAS